jgi:hypothetical protein
VGVKDRVRQALLYDATIAFAYCIAWAGVVIAFLWISGLDIR